MKAARSVLWGGRNRKVSPLPDKPKGRRAESIGVFSTTGKGGREKKKKWMQKTEKAACKRIVRNMKDM